MTPPRRWPVVAAAMLCIAWGGNQFTPLLIVYRTTSGYSRPVVDGLLGAYVLGLVPGLLVASGLSDARGRRPVLLFGVVMSVLGSAALACGPAGLAPLVIGRVLSGVGIGIAMAVGTSWVKELSAPEFDPRADAGSGARRASLALTLGLGLGAGVAGVLAQWAPWPRVLPYLVHIAVTVPVALLLARSGVETRTDPAPGRLRDRLRVPQIAHRRLLRVVLPAAPWVFGAASVSYAVMPDLLESRVRPWGLITATGVTVVTLGAGVGIQPLARRLDDRSTARALTVAMAVVTVAMACAAAEAHYRSVWGVFLLAALLGCGYGIALVSGLLEVQRIAPPDQLAGLTGVYYGLTYVGFLFPLLLAALAGLLDYPVLLLILTAAAIVCGLVTASGWSRHLPSVPPRSRA